MVVRLVRAGGEPGGVEDVELRLRAEVRGVRDAGALEERLGLGGHVARVAGVGRAGQRVEHGEGQVQRLVLAERVEHGGGRVRYQQHVGLVDRLEAADRRSVEHPALGEHVRVERLHRNGEVLHGARQVTEPDVNELHVFLSDEPEDFFSTAEHQPSLYRARIDSYISISSSGSLRTVAVGNFRAVSPMFRRCYACSAAPRTHPPDQPRSARGGAARSGRGAAVRACRASGYRRPVSQGSRNPRNRNAT